MPDYHPGELEVQTRAGVQTGAARIGKSIRSTIPLAAQTFLQDQRMIIVSTVDWEGRAWASMLTGEPGFLKTPDEETVEINAAPHPSDPLCENLHVGGAIGMIAIDFETRRRMRVNGHVKSERRNIVVHTDQVYANCPKYIQARVLQTEGTDERSSSIPHLRQCTTQAENLVHASSSAQAIRQEELTPEQGAWIERADTFFIASCHRDGGCDASHRGGPPGFVRIESATRLVFPDYSGNRMFQTLGNISVEPHAGLLFLDFESGDTLQLSGKAQVIWERERVAAFAGAERLIEFVIDRVVEIKGASSLRWQFVQYSPFLPGPTQSVSL
ncbi:MAG TPA: pyridoxamine 5'-phosphate oxidase family protein [Ktedonosporobacter sp.]|nr:pyridoxamine 5'-phosphate oxidase family protein [Ktedonosporobacter sp.]